MGAANDRLPPGSPSVYLGPGTYKGSDGKISTEASRFKALIASEKKRKQAEIDKLSPPAPPDTLETLMREQNREKNRMLALNGLRSTFRSGPRGKGSAPYDATLLGGGS